jgi:uncharacterized protein YcnI
MTVRSTVRTALLAAAAALVLAPLAAAHAELSPEEAPAGSFARFTLSVENEEADATTVKVVTKFPESVITATFAAVPGWTRTVKTVDLDQPVIGSDGSEITERIDTVTWRSDGTGSGDEVEFAFRFQLPEQPGATLFFPTVQTYSNGTVVRWIGAPGSDEPAPGVLVTEASGGGGGTSTAETEPETETQPEETTTVAITVTTAETTTVSAAPAASEDDDSNLPLILALVVLVAALAGLGYLLYRRYKQKQQPPSGTDEQVSPDEQQTQRLDPPDRPE